MTRFAATRPVYYVEEPQFAAQSPDLRCSDGAAGLTVVVPQLPDPLRGDRDRVDAALDALLQAFVQRRCHDGDPTLWYYTPAALRFTERLPAALTVYDCMDELSAFAGADGDLVALERRLLARADLVFTGGRSLYEAKRGLHGDVHLFPSSIERAHFARARTAAEPPDQASLPHPRIGYCGVIDERMDVDLLRDAADAAPQWQFVMVGPVVKIDPGILPRRDNIHYVGQRSYDELPGYMSGWDAAMLPFARNAATRFISPTKIPEYLAAGVPVVSTRVPDVVSTYEERRLVDFADDPDSFVEAVVRAMPRRADPAWHHRVDAFLDESSWDQTWQSMSALMEARTVNRRGALRC